MAPKSKINALLQLIHFDQPAGTLLLLWPSLWALWIAAEGVPDFKLLLIFIVVTFLMRSAACILHDLAGRRPERELAAAQQRPLAAPAVTANEAVILCGFLCTTAFILVLFTNTLTIVLSLIAMLLAAVYPMMKRYTNLPQIILAAAFSCGIPMAFAAQRSELPAELWLLYTGNLLWAVIYDSNYTMVGWGDGLQAGMKSTALVFGESDRLVIGVLQALCLLALLLTGQRFELGGYYDASLLVVACLFVYQQRLIKPRNASTSYRAFKLNNWVGLAIFIGIALHYQLSAGGQ